MLHTGLVSVSFRQLSPEEIVKLISKAGLESVEWGGDVHVPHGDIRRADEVRKMSEDTGISICAYGSYYRVGLDEGDKNPSFNAVLDTACTLKTECIRVWAGNKGSKDEDMYWREKVIEDSIRIADLAKKEGIKVAYEFHGNTLTDTNESAVKLMQEVDHDNMYSYWQPPVDTSIEYRLEGLKNILPWLQNVHIFHWHGVERMPLAEGADEWRKYIDILSDLPKDRFILMEFVKDDRPEQFIEDAKVLRELLP